MHTGINLFDYINYIRVKKASSLILNSDKSMTEIAHSCGYSEQSYFCKIFKKINGYTPSKYKKMQSNTDRI